MLKSFMYCDFFFSKLYDYMSYLIAHFILLHMSFFTTCQAFDYCCNLNLRLATKAKVCKGAGQE